MKRGTWNTVAWNGFTQNYWIIMGCHAESQLDRSRPEGDDMKSGILSILWKFMGLKVDHAEAVLRSQNKMRWLKWYTTIFLLL